ncbi:MAG: NAD(P)H-dependent oxidoreductase subunit E, partial [Deltaproteobacteria bacterium]|nr:NAD(P)H-dependent oxidoreductase subunit E [Deltaproteobacteria bacterium]
NVVIDRMQGADRVGDALADELGVAFGGTTGDGITLEHAPCIGMCDQAPAALVNEVVVTRLTADRAREMVRELRKHGDPRKLVKTLGDGTNAHPLVQGMVTNNLWQAGPVVFAPLAPGQAIRKALGMSPAEVIRDIKTARLRGRGGAGFPAGMKWEFTRASGGDERFVVCNADEGEPGTFKDRVILTERADLVIEGMTIAGYAIGASTGIIYLRGEYEYLLPLLLHNLQVRRDAGLLGKSVCGREGFDFDVRIQLGAGAYVCGEETALLSSCEGRRGDPKNRPPFPAQKGYMGLPTSVNNVETFCCAARIMDQGAAWFSQMGTRGSSGTKVLSVSGDCRRPGVYELPFGTGIKDLLALVGGEGAIAVQVGGASGRMIGPAEFERKICSDDPPTGGAIAVFGPERDLLWIAREYMEFFAEESCGYCTPCRAGNVLLKQGLDRVLAGNAAPEDLDQLKELGETVKTMSRCGLGQTSPNPVLTTLANFRALYDARVKPRPDGIQPTFDPAAAVATAERLVGRKSVHQEGGHG